MPGAAGSLVSGVDRRLLGPFGVVLLLALAGCSYSIPTVCGACTGFEDAANETGVNASLAHSEVVLDVRANGSARWTAKLELTGPDVGVLREDPDRREALLAALLATGYSVSPLDAGTASHRMEGNTLVVSAPVEDVADRRFGVLVVDYFYVPGDGPGPDYTEVRADRVVLRPPDGSAVANAPPGARVEGNALVWAGEEAEVSRNRYPAFALDGSPRGFETEAAIARQVAGWAARPIAVFGLIAAGLLGLVVDATLTLTVKDHRPAVTRPFGPPAGDGGPSIRAVAASGTLFVLVLAAIAKDLPPGSRELAWLAVVLPVGPLALFVVLGVAAARVRWLVRPVAATLVASPVVAGVAWVFSNGGYHAHRFAVYWLLLTVTPGVAAYALANWLTGQYADDLIRAVS